MRCAGVVDEVLFLGLGPVNNGAALITTLIHIGIESLLTIELDASFLYVCFKADHLHL